jgi:hypothetical protein
MKLSEENRTTLLTNLHKCVEESANLMANHINNGGTNKSIHYPPNGGLTDEEKQALEHLKNNDTLRDALRKVLASNSASVIFELFNIIDGTGDPDPGTGEWSEVMLIDKPANFHQHVEFLHDHFYETYWNWREKRQANFKLDLLDD